MAIRVCSAEFDAMHKDTKVGDKMIITGPLSPMWMIYHESIRGLNATFVRKNVVGTRINRETGEYDGCIGAMQMNETDLLFAPISRLVVAPNISITLVDGYDRMGIVSAYLSSRIDRDSSETHVLDMILGFEYDLWILTLFTVMIMLLALSTSLTVFRRSAKFAMTNGVSLQTTKFNEYIRRSFDSLIAMMFRQQTSLMNHESASSSRFVYFLMNLFIFYCSFYLTSMIKTDMVVVKPPAIIQSYQDVLDSNMRPAWMKISDDVQEFRQGNIGSMEAKIWQRAVTMGVNGSLIGSHVDRLIGHAMQVAGMKEVIFIQRLFGERVLTHSSCAFSRTKGIMTDKNGLYRHDPEAPEKLMGKIENHLIRNTGMSKHVDRRNQRIYESHLIPASRRFIDLNGLLQLDGVDQNYRAIEECCSDVVRIDHPNWQPVPVHHYVSLLLLSGLLLISAIVVMTIECLLCRSD